MLCYSRYVKGGVRHSGEIKALSSKSMRGFQAANHFRHIRFLRMCAPTVLKFLGAFSEILGRVENNLVCA